MVTRGDVGLMFGLCGFLLGGIGAYLGFRAHDAAATAQDVVREDGELIGTLGEKVDGLREDVKAANTRISAIAGELEERRKADADLRARLAKLEGSAGQPPK